MFSLKRKGDYRVQLTRTLTRPGRYQVELYLFTPHESHLSSWTLSEQQFFFNSLEHRFSLMGLPDKDRAGKTDPSFSLLSPHYEIVYGSWLFQYRASMDRLRQQIEGAEVNEGISAEPVKRALRLSDHFAQRLRQSSPAQSSQQRYFRLADIYFSWRAEQFFLECMTLNGFDRLDESLKDAIHAFLQQEYRHRREREYLSSLAGDPNRVWNRMNLYHRLLEYPVLMRSKVVELGAGTRKLVKAVSTMLIMLLFTYILFNAREGAQKLSLALLFGIALIYALRDLLRDDMINGITRWLRKGKPRWKIRLLKPYTGKLLALQKVWLDYRKQSGVPQMVLERSGKWATDEERQIICYRSVVQLDKPVLDHDQIQERLSLDCEALCEMIQPATNKLFAWKNQDDPAAGIQAHAIEKQYDYNLLLVFTEPGQGYSTAQRWKLRLASSGLVSIKSKNAHWPGPDEQQGSRGLERLRLFFRR